MRLTLFTALLLAPPAALHAADEPTDAARAWANAPVVANKIKDACEPVCYAGQRLDRASCLGRRVDLNFRTGLVQTFSVEDYLASYGTNPKWPTGEYLGKIMQGLSRIDLLHGDAIARQRLDRIVAKWREIQTDDGWLGTTARFKSWDIWEHKYVLLGLVDYYALTGDEKALNAARKIGDLYCATIGPGLGDINQSGHWALGSASWSSPARVAFVEPAPIQRIAAAEVKAEGWPFDAAAAKRRQGAAGLPADLKIGTVTLALIPAGEFVMGDANGSPDEQPLTRVRIDKPFYMAKCEISNAQFQQFDPAHDSRTIGTYGKDHVGAGLPVNSPQQPVVRVSWQQAVAFCDWLSRQTGRRFALPTEAQWEYACRAGTATPLWLGDATANFSQAANLADRRLIHGLNTAMPWIPGVESVDDGAVVTRNVRQGQPNPWGLCDMHGNAAEWTRTAYRPYPYVATDGRDDPQVGGVKAVRGGSFHDRPARARSGFRLYHEPWQRVADVGFRVVMEAESGDTATAAPSASD